VKHWPKMGGTVTYIVAGKLRSGHVTGKNRSAKNPMFYVNGIHTLHVRDEHVTWMRGCAVDNESKSAFVATALLVSSAR
jgi:hypothetical protein